MRTPRPHRIGALLLALAWLLPRPAAAQPAPEAAPPREPPVAADAVLAGPLVVAGETIAGLRIDLAQGQGDTVPLTWQGATPVGFAETPTARWQSSGGDLFHTWIANLELDLGAQPERPLVIRADIHRASVGGVHPTRFRVLSPGAPDAEGLRGYLADPELVPLDTILQCVEDDGGIWRLTIPTHAGDPATLVDPGGTSRTYSSQFSSTSTQVSSGAMTTQARYGLVFDGADRLRFELLLEEDPNTQQFPGVSGLPAAVLPAALAAGHRRVEIRPPRPDPIPTEDLFAPAPAPLSSCQLELVQAGFAARVPAP